MSLTQSITSAQSHPLPGSADTLISQPVRLSLAQHIYNLKQLEQGLYDRKLTRSVYEVTTVPFTLDFSPVSDVEIFGDG